MPLFYLRDMHMGININYSYTRLVCKHFCHRWYILFKGMLFSDSPHKNILRELYRDNTRQ